MLHRNQAFLALFGIREEEILCVRYFVWEGPFSRLFRK